MMHQLFEASWCSKGQRIFLYTAICCRSYGSIIVKIREEYNISSRSCLWGWGFLAYSMLFNHNIKKVVGIELDGETAAYAKDLLYAIARSENLDVEITVCQGDFFDYVCDTNAGQFDFVVMNPPYGSVKFLASDLDDVSTRTGLTEEEKRN